MASHRPPRSTLDGLPIVAIGAALMAAAPTGGRLRVASDDEPAAPLGDTQRHRGHGSLDFQSPEAISDRRPSQARMMRH